MSEATADMRTPTPFAVASMTRLNRNALLVLAALVIVLALSPLPGKYGLGAANMRLVVQFCILLSLAQMWNLLAGYAGLVSVGQQAFVGLGAYTCFFFASMRGAYPLVGVIEAGVFAGLLAIPTAAVVFRLQGAYFAIGTWVVAEIFRLTAAQLSAFGGGSGQSLRAPALRALGGRIDLEFELFERTFDFGRLVLREAVIFWCALALAAGSIALVYVLLRSRFGLALAAIRDSEPAASSLGVDTGRARYLVYVAAACVTGVCGALICLSAGRVSPDASFSLMDWTARVIFIVVIGGVGRIEGPIVGTIIFFVLQETVGDGAFMFAATKAVVLYTDVNTGLAIPYPSSQFFESWGPFYLIILGALAILVMLTARRGIWGLVADRFGIELFPIQRRLVTKDQPAETPSPEATAS